MLIKAFELAQGSDHAELVNWINAVNPDRVEKVAAVTDIYTRTGAKLAAEQLIEQYSAKALLTLEDINIDDDSKVAFKAFAEMLMKRQK